MANPWPMNEEEHEAFVDWQNDVAEGNTSLGFREWLENRDDDEQADAPTMRAEELPDGSTVTYTRL